MDFEDWYMKKEKFKEKLAKQIAVKLLKFYSNSQYFHLLDDDVIDSLSKMIKKEIEF